MSPIKAIIDRPEIDVPEKPYRMTVLRQGQTPVVIEVNPAEIPYGTTGQPGSILDIALAAGVPLEHVCGGVAACSTCHVKVTQGLESCNEPTENELDQLDEAPDLSLRSRLGCQCVPNGTVDVVLDIPSWNKNRVSEGR